jgi:long-chain acyl-CoA synthetase
MMNLGNLLSTSAARNPHRAAIVCENERISYQQLDQSTTALVGWLSAQGCRPGDRIAIHWQNSIEVAKLLLAWFKARLIAVPINVFMKAPEIAYIFAHSGAKMCFVQPDRLPVVREAAQGCRSLRVIHSSLKKADEREGLRRLPRAKENDTALILYTSGTTARPKGVTHTHRTLLEAVKLGCKMAPDSYQSVMVMTQMTYIMGLCGLLQTIATDGTLVAVPKFNAPLVLDLIEGFQCSFAFGLPSMRGNSESMRGSVLPTSKSRRK